MYEQVEKPKENKSRAVANSVTQKKSNVKQGFGFVDNRPEAIVQKKQKELNAFYKKNRNNLLSTNSGEISSIQRMSVPAITGKVIQGSARKSEKSNSISESKYVEKQLVSQLKPDVAEDQSVVQRHVTFSPYIGEDFVEVDYSTGAKGVGLAGWGGGSQESDFAEVMQDEGLEEYSLAQIMTVFHDAMIMNGELCFKDYPQAAAWAKARMGKPARVLVPDIDSSGDSTSSDDEDVEVAEEKSSGGQRVGRMFFEGDSYHITVKPKIIATIGERKLSLLVYGDSKHHNFDFFIGRGGVIMAGVNNSGGNEKDTGYIIRSDHSIVKA